MNAYVVHTNTIPYYFMDTGKSKETENRLKGRLMNESATGKSVLLRPPCGVTVCSVADSSN